MKVTGLSVTAIKGTGLREVGEVEVTEAGVKEDRRFFLIDERGRMVNAKANGWLQQVIADYSHAERTLSVSFPNGRRITAPVRHGETLMGRFTAREVPGRVVLGDFSEGFSELAGKPLRLVEAPSDGSAVDRGLKAGVSLVSKASMARLAAEGNGTPVDWRRFRMLVEIDGIAAHEEDGWIGRTVQVGEAVVEFRGHVGRCLVTTRDPLSGDSDLPTLDMLRAYRGEMESTEPLPFGVYGQVMRNGWVRIGDPVLLRDPGPEGG